MNKMSEFEEEYYRLEGKYEPLDPEKFYADIDEYVENVQKKD